MSPYTHTAATLGAVGSVGSGRSAFEQSARTLPGVSMPSSVVRSTMLMAVSMAHALASFLMERVARDEARPTAPTSSTPGSPWRKRRSEAGLASGRVTVGLTHLL